MTRYRRNIDCLSEDELHELRETLAAMYQLPASDPNSFARLASFHGGPPAMGYCRHGAPGFFTWHRAYVKAFEDALRNVGCQLMLPYWDWSSGPSTGVPPACRDAMYVNRAGVTVPNPLYSGPNASGGQTARRPDINTTAYDDLAATAQTALTASTFDTFQSQINGVHGGVHVRTGGDMSSVPTAAYDPIFFLHHANCDRLWAKWQATHPGQTPAIELAYQLDPFNRPFSISWQTGADVDSTLALGYAYRSFCLIFPPIRLWELVQFRLPIWVRDRMTSARLVVKAHHMQPDPFEVRVFLDQPRAGARTKTVGTAGFAGTIGFLGHPGAGHHEPDPVDCPECLALGHTHDHAAHASSAAAHMRDATEAHDHREDSPAPDHRPGERFDVAVDLTDAVRRLDREREEVELKLVAIGVDGAQIADDDVLFEGIELEID
jgi:tyrosinase